MEQMKPFIINEDGGRYIIRVAPYGAELVEKWNVSDGVKTPYVSGLRFGIRAYKQALELAQENGTFERFTEPELDHHQNIIGIGV